MDRLNVQSIFRSIDGEANGFDGAGEVSTFIRLKGCNLALYGGCFYCDTKYAQATELKNWMTIDEILKEVGNAPKVTITGGEPMFQQKSLALLVDKLLKQVGRVTIETNGSIDFIHKFNQIREPYKNLRFVVDFKLPSSGMMEHMDPAVFENLCEDDVIKFVISDEEDYNTARCIIFENPNWEAKKVFSPAVIDQKDYTGWPAKLAEMMIADKLYDIQYSLQVHKMIWPNAGQER